MSNQNTVTLEFKKSEFDRVKDTLLAHDWNQQVDNNQYVVFKFKSPSNSVGTMYFSGKLVFQGKEDFTPIISRLNSEVLSSAEDVVPHIGVDEVGKGDYFGPLVVVACFVTEEFVKKIEILGFKDSKKFSDGKITKLYNLVKDYPYYYPSIVFPKDYNEMILEYKNASLLLAKQHALVIENALLDLKRKGVECEHVVIDQFSNAKSRVINELGPLAKQSNLIQIHKGESDIAVAAASIIARGIFVEEWEKMDQKYNFHFPKGAFNVIDNAKLFVSVHGADELYNVAKVSFKTTKKILSLF